MLLRCGSELGKLLLPINYQKGENYVKFCKKGYSSLPTINTPSIN